jgi:hypothetical protein
MSHRTVRVQEGDGGVAVPAIQAIMRSQVALAAKGNGPAQRAVIAAVKAIEQELKLGGYVWKGEEARDATQPAQGKVEKA